MKNRRNACGLSFDAFSKIYLLKVKYSKKKKFDSNV